MSWLTRLQIGLFAALVCASTASAQTITQLPLLQAYESTEMRLQWETDSDPNGTVHEVDYGIATVTENTIAVGATIAIDATHFLHRATLSGLQPSTEYRYRVRSGSSVSPEFLFTTAGDADDAFRMAWIADNQNGQATFRTVLAELLQRDLDFIGHAGDTVDDGTMLTDWDTQWSDPLSEVGSIGQQIPILVARGNHDGESATAYGYHWLPGNGSYYAQTIGRTRFIFLDGNLNTLAQRDWLTAELASSASQDADFRIAVYHQCAHTNIWDNQNGYNGTWFIRTFWVPIMESGNVDLVVQGHAHAYQRGELNDVIHTTVGGAGGALDTLTPPTTWPFIEIVISAHHYVVMEVAGTSLSWKVFDLSGNEIDSFSLGTPNIEIPVLPHAPEP